ncbi:uncharacterized protein LOC112518235 [Cynara cardunculus var. scolymus]|uniref:Uncharacterized protein n=1 Tax=Cynara cardunculus var. scolymus TaxID=59895 RepID=A0A103XPD7_CYNCS|nr:uncharacterized protein LOC112518235 [Cynara cardunculus var. scolymus]KVH94363.1 hypothetical protein Ccrd_003576 [Cynara cardunculus var. scolymus]
MKRTMPWNYDDSDSSSDESSSGDRDASVNDQDPKNKGLPWHGTGMVLAELMKDGNSSSSSSFFSYEKYIGANLSGERHGHNLYTSTATSVTYTADDVRFIIDQFNEIVHQNNLNQRALLEAFTKGNPSATVPTICELKPIVMPTPREPPQQPPQQTDNTGDYKSDSKDN